MKKDKAIVLGATRNLAFAVGTFLIGLQKHSPDLADNVIIYHDGFSEHDKEVIAKIRNNVIFKEFTLEMLQEKLGMNAEEMKLQKNNYAKL